MGLNPYDAVVYGDLTLPSTDSTYGSEITWTSSNEDYITSLGEVTRGSETKTVILTAHISLGEEKTIKQFALRVPGIYDENYDGLVVSNEDFTSGTVSSKIESNTNASFSNNNGYLEISSTDPASASRINIYLNDNPSGVHEHAAVEFQIERSSQDDEFTLFFRNSDDTTFTRLSFMTEAQYYSAYFYEYDGSTASVTNEVSGAELGSNTNYIVRIETNPQENLCKVWINGILIGETNMRGFTNFENIQIFKKAETGNLKIDYIRTSYLDDSSRCATALYMDDFNDDVSPVEGLTEANGVLTAARNATYEILLAPEGTEYSNGEYVLEFDLGRKTKNSEASAQFSRVHVSDKNGVGIFNLMWYESNSTAIRFYNGSSDSWSSSTSKYAALTPANYNAAGKAMYVKAVINDTAHTFKLYINGIQVVSNNVSEFAYNVPTSGDIATGIAKIRFQDNGAINTHNLGSVKLYSPGSGKKSLAESTTIDYNAFDKKVNVRSMVDQTANLVVATYLSNELVSITPFNNIALKGNEDTQISVNSASFTDADTVKVFLWSAEEGSVTPLSKNASTGVINAY